VRTGRPDGPLVSAVDRHPHLRTPPPPGRVRVDLHNHSMWSGDSTTTPEELVEAVVEAGIDVLCLTDHATINGARQLADVLPCRVVVGEEVRTSAGELIGLFLTDRLPPGLDPFETARRIRDQGGLVYVPHPFDAMRSCIDEGVLHGLADAGLLDAVEVWNAKTSLASLDQRAADFAAGRGLPGGAGSDAHVAEGLGAAYVELVDFDGPVSFLAALADARVVGHRWDGTRAWRPRIVPSTTST
jgi:predicted metal-dependent phosphoesterase TrpH